MTLDKDLQSQVDAQLLEQGSFTVLDFLMDSGRLLPDDYERWRRGEIDSLDDVFMGSMEKIREQIEGVASYARTIGLVQQQQTFHAWRTAAQDAAEPLLISADAALRGLLAGRFAPAQNVPQLDLFFDNPVVALANGIVRALSAQNREETQRLLERLYVHAPNHADLPGYDRLLAALERRQRPIDDPQREMALLMQVGPTAQRLMGSQARDLLTPLWQQLAEALRGHPFRADAPEHHRSFCLSQAQDWDGVARSVGDEPQWWLHAPLCLRLAQSSFHLHQRTRALTAWFHLCWRAPRQAATALDDARHPDTGIAASWQRFIDDVDEMAADGPGPANAPDGADFPAWSLLQEPGLTQQLAADLPTGNTPAEDSYRCVHRWLEARRAARHDEEMALRRTLQVMNPLLFAHLIRSV